MMMGHGKCPTCGTESNTFNMEQATIGNRTFGPFINGLSICCSNPGCKTILGVIADPSAIAADVAQRVVNKIQGKKP